MEKLLFIGLGNPGAKFSETRHNLGIVALQNWVTSMASQATTTLWNLDMKIGAEMATVTTANVVVNCLFPATFMNDSGGVVKEYIKSHPIDINKILILHDDMELPLGITQLVSSGSAKGHNGVRSVYDSLGTQDIARLRLGIGRPHNVMEPKDFVLSKFGEEEQVSVRNMFAKVAEQLSAICIKGVIE